MASSVLSIARARCLAYHVLVVLCFSAGLALALLGSFEAKRPEAPKPKLGGVLSVRGFIAHLGSLEVAHRVAFIGDSTTVGYPPPRRIPTRLQEYLEGFRDLRDSIRVHNVGMEGLGPYDYYFAAHEIARARPSMVVMCSSLASLSERFTQRFSRPAFATLLAPAKLPEAIALPLHGIGLTADRVLLLLAIGQADLFHPLAWLENGQYRVEKAHERLSYRFDEAMSHGATQRFELARKQNLMAQSLVPGKRRYNAAITRAFYGEVLDGEAQDLRSLRMLEAAVRTLSDAGIPTLVYIGPINWEYIESLDLMDERLLARSINAIAEAVDRAGGELIDLHDLLPDAAFHDQNNHLTIHGIDGPRQVAKALVLRVATMLRASGAAD